MNIEILYQIILMLAGIGTIMYGIKVMNGGIENSLGFRFKKILAKHNNKHFSNFLLGTGMSFVVQTSTVTNIMSIGLINIGTINLSQGIAICLGAGLGGSLALVLVMFESVSIVKILSVLAFVGAIMLVLAKSSKSELISKIVMGFGLLCFGITILGSSVEQIVSLVDLSGLFHSINNPMLYFLICLALTMIMQSGYPVIVLLVSFVGLGLVDAETACYGILGVSLGSTLAVSILVAAIGEGNNGKRIVAFNILHKIVFTIIIGLLMLIPGWVNYLHESICGGIASISLIVFDIFICFVPIILIPFSRQLASLMQIIIRDKKSSNKNGYSSFELDEKTLNNPVVAYSKLRLNIQRIISLLQDINKKNHNELFETDQYSSQKNKIKAVEKLIRLTNNNLISIAGKFVGEDKNKINTLIDIMPNLQRLVKISTKIDELSLKKAEIQKDMHSETYKFLSSYSTQILDFADGVQKLIDESVSKQEKNNELKILFATNDIMVKERNKSKKKIATNSNLNKNNVYYFNIIYELESMQQDYFDITIKTMLLED